MFLKKMSNSVLDSEITLENVEHKSCSRGFNVTSTRCTCSLHVEESPPLLQHPPQIMAAHLGHSIDPGDNGDRSISLVESLKLCPAVGPPDTTGVGPPHDPTLHPCPC